MNIQQAFRQHDLVLGVDGGGTKTRAVITDAQQHVIGEGVAGPSNPLRVGVSLAAAAVRTAIDQACKTAAVPRAHIVAAEVGLAGVRRIELRERMREALMGLGINSLEVVTDADIALFGATNGKPGIVIIAGTGSICCGINKLGTHACAGGWGPIAGDEGSGSWIARQALQRIAQAVDGRGAKTSLVEAGCEYFGAQTPDDLGAVIYNPSATNDCIAGFGRLVIEAARAEDAVAREILISAGHELGVAAATVISKLGMEGGRFQVAYVGGVFAADHLVLDPLRRKVAETAPDAFFAAPVLSPAIAAARMAREHIHQLALAG